MWIDKCCQVASIMFHFTCYFEWIHWARSKIMDILKISTNEFNSDKVSLCLIKIPTNKVPNGTVDRWVLVQVMVWHGEGNKSSYLNRRKHHSLSQDMNGLSVSICLMMIFGNDYQIPIVESHILTTRLILMLRNDNKTKIYFTFHKKIQCIKGRIHAYEKNCAHIILA